MKHISAQIVVEGDLVLMKKTCEKHGDFMDKLSDDVDFYKWSNSYVYEFGSRIDDTSPQNIVRPEPKVGCPFDCGMCSQHKSAPNFVIMEWFPYWTDGRYAIVTEALEPQQRKGRFRIPDRPGLGVELNDDYLARFDQIQVR